MSKKAATKSPTKKHNVTPVDKADNSLVLIGELQCESGRIGTLTLNAEKTLNSLTLDMVRTLSSTLAEWEADDELSAVILSGAGPKAFCAGGDIQALYHSATHPENGVCIDAETFFLEEYQLNYQIHCYDKPIICIGDGYVMGGGLGLMAGASHRVVTEKTRMAMPEVSIGLFPDVGSTVFLNQVPYNLGYFLALTGTSLNGADALFCRLADFAIESSQIQSLFDQLQGLSLSNNDEENHQLITAQMNNLKAAPKTLPLSPVKQNLVILEEACRHDSLSMLTQAISAFDDENSWLARAKNLLADGSALSTLMIYEQLKRHRYADLQSAFMSELVLITNMVRYPDFAEGVRALLIDKDKQPKWVFEHVSQVPCTLLESFFTPPWEVNPLEAVLN
jgi:enoyl-CoA hydratase/carnithine racemase